MNLFMLTTKFDNGLLDSPKLVPVAQGVRTHYKEAAPSFKILNSWKVSKDTTVDICQASNMSEAEKAAKAIERASGTRIQVAQIHTLRDHLTSIQQGR